MAVPGLNDAYEAGMAAFHAGRYEEAVTHLAPIADGASPRAMLARFYAGQAHLRLGMQRFRERHYAVAARHFRRAAEANPVAGGLCRYLASCYVAVGRHDLAAGELSRALEDDPDDTETLIRAALVAWKRGRSDDARTILQQALRRHPDEPELLFQLATIESGAERYEEAIELLRRCLESQPDHARAHMRLAHCLGVTGRVGEAYAHLQHAQRLEPNDALVAFQLSLLAGLQGEAAAGARSWREPVVLDVHDRRAMDRLATIVREEPEFVEAFLTLPETQVDGDVFSMLLAALQRAIEKHPEYADLRHQCSRVLTRLGRLSEAVGESERALTINPRYINALIQLAQLYQATCREEEAAVRLERAVAFGADYPDVHYMLGRLYQSRGSIDKARAAYERALQLNGGFAAARQALDSLAA